MELAAAHREDWTFNPSGSFRSWEGQRIVQAFEKRAGIDPKRPAKGIQSRRADPVLARFVFLDLLEGDADLASQPTLTESRRPTQASDTLAQMDID